MLPPFKILTGNIYTNWRMETFWTKEPETIEWIRLFSNSLNSHDIFVDVGANVGLYSLFAAALYPDIKIIAIEPERHNFFELVQNIQLNNFKNIIPLNVAIGAYNDISFFESHSTIPGNSDGKLIPKGITKQSIPILSITLDSLFDIGNIAFLKIDIDGGEYDAIYGMRNNLGKTKTMLIEFDNSDKRYETVMKYIKDGGYIRNQKLNALYNHSRFRREKEGHGNIENIVFDLI